MKNKIRYIGALLILSSLAIFLFVLNYLVWYNGGGVLNNVK